MIPLLFRWRLFDVTGSSPGKLSLVLSGHLIQPSCEDCPDATQLGELKACVHTDSVAQLVAQDALLAVVGQLEQVEARWWSGKSTTRLLLANSEKASKNTAKGVSSVLDAGNALLVQTGSYNTNKTCKQHRFPSFLALPDHLKLQHNGWRKAVWGRQNLAEAASSSWLQTVKTQDNKWDNDEPHRCKLKAFTNGLSF